MNMQCMFQQSMFMTTGVFQFINSMVDIQLLADPGTHSAHCAADRGLSRYSSWYGRHAPVVVQRQVLWLVVQKTVESPQLQWFWASSSSWTRSLCPLVQRLGVRNAWFDC